MTVAKRTAASTIGYEEEEIEINFRAERDHIGEGLDIIDMVKTVSPLL